MRRLAGVIAGMWMVISTLVVDAADVRTQVVTVGGVSAILLTPARPHGGLVLMSGGGGDFQIASDGTTGSRNSLVRNRMAFAARGFAVLTPEGNVDVKAAVDYMRSFGRVTLVGTSRGTQRAARGIAAGAEPYRLVLTSGFLSNASGDPDNVMSILGSPARLPPTLLVHHRQDACKYTLPAGVQPFMAWAGAKARVVWLDGGETEGNPCEALAHHGFYGIDAAMVGAVAGFAAR